MKKVRLSFFLLTFIAFFSLRTSEVFAFSNGDFESGSLSPWETYSGAQASITEEQAHGGAKSVKIQNGSTNAYGIQQQISSVTAGKIYKFSGFGKVTDSNVDRAFLRIGWYDAGGDQKSTDDSSQITGVGDWVELTVEKVAPSGAVSAKVRAVVASKNNGTTVFAFFDDLSLTEITPTSTPTSGPTSTPTATPTITQTPAPTQTPATYSNISITEFMANPDSGNEWVELYNNNDSEVNLYGWYIDDLANGGRSPQSISGTIPAKSYKQYFLDGYFLDNDGDDVRLLDGGQNEKDKKSYTSSTKGKSWSKDSSGNWCETDPTPGSANPACPTAASTATPTPKVTGSITPTPKLSPTPSLKPTPTGELEPTSAIEIGSNTGPLVLGEGITPTPTEALKGKERFRVTAAIFIGSGLVLLGISGFLLFKKKI
jgi:hypothetical protein